MQMTKVDFNIPSIVGNEFKYIADAYNNSHISGDGIYTKKCQSLIEESLSVPKALLTTSCTHALELAALLINIKPGDEVIIPSFTFVSTVNAFAIFGAKPVFIDIRQDTLNLDENLLENLITEKTRAIVPVHYAGIGCEMEKIMTIAQKYSLNVIEDNAHGFFGKYKNQFLGTFGSLATQSFHETKNISCGEGGAILINDQDLIDRAEILREKGTNRSRFFRGLVDKYTWVDIGSSYLPSDILAAVLFAQLEMKDKIQTKRKKLWDNYYDNLSEWATQAGIKLPHIPAHCEQAYHMFYLILPSLQYRQSLMDYLKDHGVYSVFHYQPLHLSEMGKNFNGKKGDCPVTEDISDRLLRLPLYYSLTKDKQQIVIDALKSFTF